MSESFQGSELVTGNAIADHVLLYWFGGKQHYDEADVVARLSLWVGKASTTDEYLRTTFADVLEQAARGEFDGWDEIPSAALALTILLDQFPRHIYRGTPRSFQYDEAAAARVTRLLQRRIDKGVAPVWRCFFYVPLEHLEDPAPQRLAVSLFDELLAETALQDEPLVRMFRSYSLRHCEIIERFGRFPHRNAILGRTSSPEEIAFLNEPNSSF